VTAHPAFDVVMGQYGLLRPFLYEDFSMAGRQQDISELYFFEGSLYISDVSVYLKKLSFYHDRTLPYVVPKWKAFEVDDMTDLICVEAILRNMDRLKKYL
jgi:N-acylneuraminate cytidylyltransferase/CMP-N,N'-diacetyllegionaminic acid synthase